MEDKGFTKTDMERVGIFKEMEYVTLKDPYKANMLVSAGFNAQATKGKQMLPGGSKKRSALQHGYFKEKFDRVMEGEAYTDTIRLRRVARNKEAEMNIGKAFLPSNGDKLRSGLGSYYGTIQGPVSAFSPVVKPGKGYVAPGKNLYTNPGKKGTGFGYIGVTMGKYANYMTDEFDRAKEKSKKENEAHKLSLKAGAFRLNMHPTAYFNDNPYRSDRPLPPPRKTSGASKDVKPFKPSSPAKHDGGCKAGTFDPYPSHPVDGYTKLKMRPVHVTNKFGKIFVPSPGPKSCPVSSVVNYNVHKTLNSSNFRTVNSVMSY